MYGVKILIHRATCDPNTGEAISELPDKLYYRWFWTSGVFNDKYTIVDDYDSLTIDITPTIAARIDATNLLEYTALFYKDATASDFRATPWESLGA